MQITMIILISIAIPVILLGLDDCQPLYDKIENWLSK
jgi:hypothetical protein